MKKRIYIIGSISHGTKDSDLLDSFADALEFLSTSNYEYQKYKDVIKESKRYRDFLIEHEDKLWKPHHEKLRDSILETVSYIINEDLFDALNEFVPPYFYFGSHPGDGSDYGFWLSEDIENDFDGLKVSDLSEVPKDHAGEILLVNDHGNTSLYYKYRTSKKLHEIWGIV